MKFFRLQFTSAPADEGDRCRPAARRRCPRCGLDVVPVYSEFEVPEDRIERLHAGIWGKPDLPIFSVGALLAVENELADAMAGARLTGVSFAPMEISSCDNDAEPLPVCRWAKITGRCVTNDVWERVTTTCPDCGTARTERVNRAVRTVHLKSSSPQTDFSRAREDAVGIVISERARNFFEETVSNWDEHVELTELPYIPDGE